MELNLYALTVDLILIAIFAITVYLGWRRGIVSAATGILSLVGAWMISGMFSYLLYGILQRTVFDPLVTDIVGNLVLSAVSAADMTADAASQAIAASLDSIRGCTDIFGITLPLDAASLSGILGEGINDAVTDKLIADIASPIAQQLAEWSAYLLLFIVAYLLLRLLFKILDLVMKLPILNGINRALGSIGGIILGAGYAFFAAKLLAIVLGILVTRGTLPPDVMGGTVFSLLAGLTTASM